MKKIVALALAAVLSLSLAGCGDVLVDLDTPKSEELTAQYDFYPDSMNTIRAEMQITPEQADEVFIALVSCGLDGKINTVSESDGAYKVRWGTNSLEVTMNDDGTVAEIGDGKDVLYPEYKQYKLPRKLSTTSRNDFIPPSALPRCQISYCKAGERRRCRCTRRRCPARRRN